MAVKSKAQVLVNAGGELMTLTCSFARIPVKGELILHDSLYYEVTHVVWDTGTYLPVIRVVLRGEPAAVLSGAS